MRISPVPKVQQGILIFLSFVIVAFGQPAWNPYFGVMAAMGGFALFWRVLVGYAGFKNRFLIGTFWFTGIQLVQLSWFTYHPFYYAYIVLPLLALIVGVQFGVLALLFHPNKITKLSRIIVVSALWTFIEWSRLFLLSGYTWNPVGLALAGNLPSLQIASVTGVFGLSFLVILTNLMILRAWLQHFKVKSIALAVLVAGAPMLLGGMYYRFYHDQITQYISEGSPHVSSLLVQTAFPVEEFLSFTSREQYVDLVIDEWRQILQIMKKHRGRPLDLIALPEYVVPFGTYSFIYSYERIKQVFQEIYGPESLAALPAPEFPLGYYLETDHGKQWMVNNAFWVQAIANNFDAGVVIGLEDAEDVDGKREYYSSAIYIEPESRRDKSYFDVSRYAKRVLVPMGEYIPFSFFQGIAAEYGVMGSFTAGTKSEVWSCGSASFGVSICYEETFGDMMRENKLQGANLMINITNDAWFPGSRLTRQHLEHARLRTVENGIPLLRACNTGITCAIDALGRDIAVLGEDDATREKISDALYVRVPIYNYQTIYSRFGDSLIIGLSFLIVLFGLGERLFLKGKSFWN